MDEPKPLTDLDKKLQEIAVKNWWQFVDMLPSDAYLFLKICLLRQDGKTYGQIKQRLELTKAQVQYACGKCDIKPDE